MTEVKKIEVNLPLSYIASVFLFSGKNDVRYYLNGLALDAGHLVATNGHFMGALPVEHSLNDIIIPSEAVKSFLKLFTAKEKRLESGVIVTLTLEHDKPGTKGSLSYGHKSIGFETIDARYPNWERVVPNDDEKNLNALFNLDYMATFAKAARFLGCKVGTANIEIYGNSRGTLINLTAYEAFIGVVMATRF